MCYVMLCDTIIAINFRILSFGDVVYGALIVCVRVARSYIYNVHKNAAVQR